MPVVDKTDDPGRRAILGVAELRVVDNRSFEERTSYDVLLLGAAQICKTISSEVVEVAASRFCEQGAGTHMRMGNS